MPALPDDLAAVGVRWAWLGVPVLCLAARLAYRPPDRRAGAAAIVASCWCLPGLAVGNLAAASLGWWSFHAEGGLLLGTPIEALIGWSLWWGALPALVLHRAPLVLVLALAGWIDALAMPRCVPVLQLGPRWLLGEAVLLATVLLPALLAARATRESRRLPLRSVFQAVAFGGITFFLLPAGALAWEGATLATRLIDPCTALAALLVLPAAAALVLALSAVVEFATRGGGTPLPLDPPEFLVVTGPYAFVRNPMQMGASLLLLISAAALSSVALVGAAGVAVAYSIGLARFDESLDLGARFGARYARYRGEVRSWLPRWRPYRDRREQPARLYYAAGCGPCGEVARFVLWLRPTALELHPAQHYERPLLRVTYRDGDHEAEGVAALGRALEHGCLPFALAGLAIRLPLVCPLLQLIVDASGGHARPAPALPTLQE